jgi:hypothetical protein
MGCRRAHNWFTDRRFYSRFLGAVRDPCRPGTAGHSNTCHTTGSLTHISIIPFNWCTVPAGSIPGGLEYRINKLLFNTIAGVVFRRFCRFDAPNRDFRRFIFLNILNILNILNTPLFLARHKRSLSQLALLRLAWGSSRPTHDRDAPRCVGCALHPRAWSADECKGTPMRMARLIQRGHEVIQLCNPLDCREPNWIAGNPEANYCRGEGQWRQVVNYTRTNEMS